MDALTLLPPILAILIAVIWRNVYAALLVALVASETLINSYNLGAGLIGAVDRTVGVFESQSSTQTLLFCLLIGVLIAFMRDSGGVAAMARALLNSKFAHTRRRAELAVAATGSSIFIETNVSLLSSGVLGRPLYDAHRLSRERLAYIIDSTSAPISVIVLLNAWGAYALELVSPYGFASPQEVVFLSIPWNFYPLLTLALVVFTAWTGWTFGPMRTADKRTTGDTADAGPAPTRPLFMWLPVLVMVGGALVMMAWTGRTEVPADTNLPWVLAAISNGQGARSILIAICLAILVLAVLLRLSGVFKTAQLQEKAFSGIGEMVPLVTVLLLSIALGASLRALGTGAFVAEAVQGNIPALAIPALLFAAAAAMSFMTGTSWGTYGILIPIAMPLAIALGLPPALVLAAVLGGGVFGDHCSPISDTTLIASVAAGSDHLSHVKTQLPYAIVAGAGATALYLLCGILVT